MHIWANWKNILRKYAPSKLHLNKYGSYFRFILLLTIDIKLKPRPTTAKWNDILWELLPFPNCSFSTERMDYQFDSLLSETKLDSTVLSSELEIGGYELVRSDQSRRGGGVACFVKNKTISYNRKHNFCINTESIFIDFSA